MSDDRRSFGEDPLEDLDEDTDAPETGLHEAGWTTSPSDPTEAVRIISSTDEPSLRLGADDTGPMPHWTEPPTGEMPSLFGDPPKATMPTVSWSDDIDDDWEPFERSGSGAAGASGGAGAADQGSGLGAPPAAAGHGASDVVIGFDEPSPAAEPRITPIRTKRPAAPPTPAGGPSRRDESSRVKRSGGSNGRNVPVAIAVGVAIAALYLLLAKLGPRYVVALVVVVLGLAAAELYESQRKAGYQPATFVGIAAAIGMPLVAYWRGAEGLPVVAFVAVATTALWLLMSGTLDSAPMPNMSASLLGVFYVGFLGSYASLILRQPHGVSAMFTLALATVGYDIVGLVAGSTVGRSPLIRWVSPNKTVEGLLAGMLAAFGFTVLCNIGHVAPWNDRWIHTIQLGIVIAIAAPIGDLVESMLKRSLGVKDMGDLLPGHGGVLDRFDAFLFVFPAVYYLGQVLNVPQIR